MLAMYALAVIRNREVEYLKYGNVSCSQEHVRLCKTSLLATTAIAAITVGANV